MSQNGLLLRGAIQWRHWSYVVYPSGRFLIENRTFPCQKHKLPLLLYSLADPQYLLLGSCTSFVV